MLIDPAAGPDPSFATNWRASSAFGGTPGVEDGRALPANPLGDDNLNGIADLLDYSMGNDLVTEPILLTARSRQGKGPSFFRPSRILRIWKLIEPQ